MSNRFFETWSKQYRCFPQQVHYPTSVEDTVNIMSKIRGQDSRIKVFGSGHSPSNIAMSDDELIIINQLNNILSVNASTKKVVAQGGVLLSELNQVLDNYGLAIPNLGSISEQTLAGAMATATHGTGLNYGVLPTLIEGMTLVTASGDLVYTSKEENPEILKAAQCNLGVLGIVTEMELKVCDAFDLEVSEQPNTLENVLSNLDNRLQADHYRFWYLPHADRVWEWTASRKPPSNSYPRLSTFERIRKWYDERLIGYQVFQFLLYLGIYNQALVPGINRWYTGKNFFQPRQQSGKSFNQFNFDCLFKQHVNEWCIPIENTSKAIEQIRQMISDRGYRVHLPIEVRFVAKDDIWLSPCFGRDSCYIGVIAYLPYGQKVDYEAYFNDYEAIMANLGGRPHWAKTFGPDENWLKNRYPHWEDFQAVRYQLDPQNRFGNTYSDRVLGKAKEPISNNKTKV